MRRLAVSLLLLGGAAAFLRRRRPSRYVEVEFEDGSAIRLEDGPEARKLLSDADTIIAAA